VISKLRKHWLGCGLGAILATAIGFILFYSPIGSEVIHRSYDIPFALRRTYLPTDAVIVYLDEVSHEVLNQPFGTGWNRAIHARLLEQLKIAGAKAVVFDILFDEPGADEKAEEALARAIRNHGKVILSGEYRTDVLSDLSALVKIDKPLQKFRDAGADWGVTQFPIDSDGTIRRHLMVSDELPSLAAVTAKALGIKTPPSEKWINYYGPPGWLPHESYYRALSNELAPDFFRDKVVFIGARQSTDFSGKGKDEFPTAFTWTDMKRQPFAPGVEIHATAFLNLLRKDWLTRLPFGLELMLILLTGIVAGWGLPLARPQYATLLAAGAALVLLGAAWIGFRFALVWFAWLVVLSQIVAAFAYSILFNSIQAYVEKQVLERSLAIHLSPRRVKQLLKRPDLLQPGAEKQELSIMFSDIADFSTISDRTRPDKLFEQLNKYFGETIPCIHQTDGTVVKLIGDAIFAIWNAPEAQANHAVLACRAALLLRDKLVEFESANESFPMHTRVGLHSGPACVGNSGSNERFDYTAIGANINLASRLEGLNKYLGTDILASDEIIGAVDTQFVSRAVGHFKLKGCDRVVEVHELLGLPESAEKTKAWRDTFADALRKFKRADFAEAEIAFRKVLEARPQDGPSKFYLKLVDHHRAHAPAKGWFGEVNMEEK
jgi:adenylate cyclase